MTNPKIDPTEQTITYTVSVTITRPVRLFNTDDTIEDTAAWMISREAERELEKEILKALRKLDGDCDCEVLEVRS